MTEAKDLYRRIPSLTALRAFEAVVRMKNFKAAAMELNVTPSAISHQIKQLEDDLGCSLMSRGRGGFELTQEGLELSNTVRRSFLRIFETAERLRSKGRQRIVLQVYSTFAVRWLFPRLSKFEEQFPDIELSVVTGQEDIDLTVSTMDACVYIGAEDQNKQVDCTYLFTSNAFPVCSRDYLEKSPRLKTPEHLSQHALLQVYPSQEDWAVWLRSTDTEGVDASGASRFDSYDHALNLAASGLGVALALDLFVEKDLASKRLIELFPEKRVKLPKSWYFASLKSRKDDPKILAFRDWLIAETQIWRDEAAT